MKLFDFSIKELKVMLKKALSADISSDYALDEEMKNHSPLHGEWSALSAKAKKIFRLKEVELESLTAEIVAEIRQKAIDNGKALAATAPVKKEMVPLDDRWKQAQKQHADLGEFVDLLSGIERAMNNRAWLLIRLARNREGNIEPSV
ncbi:MAG: hypothetical protein ACW99G_04785, partial [Candidatus Thorarchaeota archaeon]